LHLPLHPPTLSTHMSVHTSHLVMPRPFFLHASATPEIYTLSLHDALPIYRPGGGVEHRERRVVHRPAQRRLRHQGLVGGAAALRSEEHTSELQSRVDLVCRLLLEKKNKASNMRRSSSLWNRTRADLVVGMG